MIPGWRGVQVQHQLWSEGKGYSYWNTNPALCLRHRSRAETETRLPGGSRRRGPRK